MRENAGSSGSSQKSRCRSLAARFAAARVDRFDGRLSLDRDQVTTYTVAVGTRKECRAIFFNSGMTKRSLSGAGSGGDEFHRRGAARRDLVAQVENPCRLCRLGRVLRPRPSAEAVVQTLPPAQAIVVHDAFDTI